MMDETRAEHPGKGPYRPPAEPIPCKGILDSNEFPKESRQWKRAKKYSLILKSDQLAFNGHVTKFEDIDRATIHIYQSALFLEYAVLSITSDGITNHFGIKYDDIWKSDLPFEVERIKEGTPFLLFRKSLIIVIIIYIFWQIVKH